MITIYKTKQEENYEVKTKKYKGKNCLVVPVVMMVEGVHAGSKGPLLHTINDLGKFPASWDGIPVVINHPQNETGQNISANSPEVLEIYSVGKVFNTHVNGTKLMAEAYIYPEKLKIVSNNTLEAIKETKHIEVSVGVFTEDELVENGDWNGEKYNAIARNHRPDHLALLPGAKGACSIEDGCGIRTNEQASTDDGGVEKEAPEKIINNKKEVLNMERGNTPPCGQCMEKIVAIINDNSTPYTAEHREFLLTQKEEFLDAIMPKKVIEVNAGDEMMKKSDCEKTKVVTNTVTKEVIKEVPMTLSAEDQAALNYGKKQLAEKRAAQIEGIQANTSKELWPDEMLTTMSEDTLERLFNSVKKVDYSPMGSNKRTEVTANKVIAPMLPTGMDVEETKK